MSEVIPLYVYVYNRRFFHVDGNAMGNGFHDKWLSRRFEFPTNKIEAIERTFVELSKFCSLKSPPELPPRRQYHPRAEHPTKREMELAMKLLFNMLGNLELPEETRSAGLQVAAWLRDKIEDAK